MIFGIINSINSGGDIGELYIVINTALINVVFKSVALLFLSRPKSLRQKNNHGNINFLSEILYFSASSYLLLIYSSGESILCSRLANNCSFSGSLIFLNSSISHYSRVYSA